MGGALGTDRSQLKQDELERMLDQLPPEINLDDEIPFASSWIFSVVGALIAIPVGVKRKSYGPLVFYGMTGTMLDIIMSVQDHEMKRQKWLKDYFAKHPMDSTPSSQQKEFFEDFPQQGVDTDPWKSKNK